MPDKKLNLNSVLTLLVGGALSLFLTFVWNSVLQTREGVIRLESNQAQMQKALGEVIPRTELELRFKNIDTQLIEMRVRQQNTEVELIKLKDHK